MRQALCVAVVAAAAAIGAGPVAAEASPSTTVLTIPASAAVSPGTLALIEACVGEPVTILGSSLVVIHQTSLPDGSNLLVVHRNPQGAFALGVVSGGVYRIGASDTFVQVLGPSGTFVFTFTAALHVLGPGDAAGFFGSIVSHITVTPAGDLTAETEIVDIHCT